MSKRTITLVVGGLILISVAGVKAAGSIPGDYGSARSLLAMLWDKLDQAIVGNYDAKLLTRYHDHTGNTGDGSFVSKGLKLGPEALKSDFAIGTSKLKIHFAQINVQAGQSSDSTSDPNLAGAEIIGYYPNGNQDQFVDNIQISGTTLTLTLAGNATGINSFIVHYLEQ